MVTRERLQQYRFIVAESERIKRLLHESEERARELSAILYAGNVGMGDTPRSSSKGKRDKVGEYMSRNEEISEGRRRLAERYMAKLRLLDAEQLAIEQAVEALPSREREVIRAKYLEGENWATISAKLSYSRRQLYRIRDRAVHLLEQAPEA